ncbi:MAG: hypothetical protein Q7S02_03985 [bacterium]|nr:hypothetical protein [bacterium]
MKQMLRHIIRTWSSVLVVALILAALVPVSVRASAPGALVRASQPALYSIGSDGKRYAFANEKIYRTWYADFLSVERVSDTALAAIPLGGVVHYKPGMRLVKVPTDPKVYAVDRGGVLRWVQTEVVARALYGATWHRIVDDLPVEFFSQYSIGSPIDGHEDYDPESVRRGTTTIDKNRQAVIRMYAPAPSASPPGASSPSVSPSAPPPASAAVVPPCADQRLTVLPVAFDTLESITPLGNLNPPEHVFPTDHTYWHLLGRERGTWTLEPLVAPGDVTITMIRSNPDRDESRTDGGDEYAIHFKLCEHVEAIFGHVKALAPKLQQAITGTSCNIPNWVECARAVSVRVAAGERIGEIGGSFRVVDLGFYDDRVTLGFVNPQRAMHTPERQAVCPFEYFDAERRAQIDAKLPALVRGTCGVVMQDVPGTLAGNWFLSAVPFGTISKNEEQLAFSYEAGEPARRVLSTGGQLGFKTFGPGFAIGPEQSSGRMNRAYRDVTPDGTIYCFQHTPSMPPTHDRVLVQMVSRDELKIEYQQAPQLNAPDFLACKGDEQFVNPQMYRR